MRRPFADRAEAGCLLAGKLAAYAGRTDVIVLALPRGGVPVGYEIALALNAPLDVFLVRKLGAPGQEELAMGAIASGGVVVINDEVVRALRISPACLKAEFDNERRELARREQIYRGGLPPLEVKGKTVILVDDGLATGSTMRAAVTALRRKEPAAVIVAAPVAASSTCAEFSTIADGCICAVAPEKFHAVGAWYENFAQINDAEVCDLLRKAQARKGPAEPVRSGSTASENGHGPTLIREANAQSSREPCTIRDVVIPAGTVLLKGALTLPASAEAVVLVAHGSGSSRSSPRNQHVARVLHDAGLGTLLVDLLEENEADDRARAFDIKGLAARLQSASDWLKSQPETCAMHVGYFGASTGAGAALWAAATSPLSTRAVVSRGGRPDLARAVLRSVTAPTLLIVGGQDEFVLELNRESLDQLTCTRELHVIPGASHLFPEPGALDEVARLARDWFVRYLSKEKGTPTCTSPN
jgi:putative phosphoribosyl transferase